MPDATLVASYHAYRFVPNRRPDKAFTPHPAVGAQCLMRRLTRLIMPGGLCRTVGRIRRVSAASGSRHTMPDATLDASYHAYKSVPNRRPDKAFTPHPAVGAQCLMRRLTRLIMPTGLCRTVGRIRHVTNRAPEISTGSPRAPLTHQPTAQRLPAWRSPSFAPRHTRRGHETHSGEPEHRQVS
jgi:hypothetical protein